MCESEELLFIQGCYVVRAKTSLETLESVAEAKSNRLPDKTVSSEGLHSRQIAPTARTGPPKGGPGAYDLLAALLEPFDRDLEKMRNHPELGAASRGAPRIAIGILTPLFPEFRKALEVLDREASPDAEQYGAARLQTSDVTGLRIEQCMVVTHAGREGGRAGMSGKPDQVQPLRRKLRLQARRGETRSVRNLHHRTSSP